MKTPLTKNTLLQFAQGNRTNQKLQESIFSPAQIKLKSKKSSPLKKIKLHSTAPCEPQTFVHLL